MQGSCGIFLGKEEIGQAIVEKKGLYYHFHCRLQLSGEVIFRLVAVCGDKKESLGIPVPKNGAFALDARLPISRLGGGKLHLEAVPRHPQLQGKFIPLSPETPFPYLSRLENAFLAEQGGQVGLVISD